MNGDGVNACNRRRNESFCHRFAVRLKSHIGGASAKQKEADGENNGHQQRCLANQRVLPSPSGNPALCEGDDDEGAGAGSGKGNAHRQAAILFEPARDRRGVVAQPHNGNPYGSYHSVPEIQMPLRRCSATGKQSPGEQNRAQGKELLRPLSVQKFAEEGRGQGKNQHTHRKYAGRAGSAPTKGVGQRHKKDLK